MTSPAATPWGHHQPKPDDIEAVDGEEPEAGGGTDGSLVTAVAEPAGAGDGQEQAAPDRQRVRRFFCWPMKGCEAQHGCFGIL